MQRPGWREAPARPGAYVARGSASRERNHGAGGHPIPFRTRKLSPASPKVLRRKAAGGQVVPLAGGAFLHSHSARSSMTLKQPLEWSLGDCTNAFVCAERIIIAVDNFPSLLNERTVSSEF